MLGLLERFNITTFKCNEGKKKDALMIGQIAHRGMFFSLSLSSITVGWSSSHRRGWNRRHDSHSIHTSTDLEALVIQIHPPKHNAHRHALTEISIRKIEPRRKI